MLKPWPTDMQKTVLSFGETLWDLLPTASVLGGAPFNFAYRVNSLGDRGIIVSRLGRDDLGEKARAQVCALGMDTGYMQWDEQLPTGTVQITLDENSNPDYYIVPGVAYDNIELTDGLLQAAIEADCICYGTLSQRTPMARQTLEQLLGASSEGLKLLDINLRKDCYSLDTVTASLHRADVLRLNDEEARQLGELLGLERSPIPAFSEEMIRRWRLSHCVVTLGSRGAFAASSDGGRAYVPGYRVDLVDPCGAGDAFTAGFIHRLLRDRPIQDCLDLGNAMGAIVASQQGATSPVGTDDIKEFMVAGHERILESTLERFIAAQGGA